jgi:hypothetical protein
MRTVTTETWDIQSADGKILIHDQPDNLAVTEQALAEVSGQLTHDGARLTLLEMPPVIGAQCGKPSQFSSSACRVRVDSDKRFPPYNALFRRVAGRVPGVSTISITDTICPGGVCVAELNGIVLRYDGQHFTAPAARWLAPLMYAQLVHAGALPA